MPRRIPGFCRFPVALGALVLASCAALRPAGQPAPPAAPVRESAASAEDAAAAEARMADARRLFGEGKSQDGAALLASLVGSPSFEALPSEDRYRALELAGRAELALGERRRAYGYLARAAQLPESAYADVVLELRTADQLRDAPLEIDTLTMLINRWPEHLGDLKDEYATQILANRDKLPHGALLPLLETLYRARWKNRFGIEPSDAWRDLTLLLIERRRLDAAIDVAGHVVDPYLLVSMRADRRFDPVTSADPERFDVSAAQSRRVLELERKDGDTRSLEVKDMLIAALLDEQRYGVALAIADSAADDIRSTNFPERLYVDYEDEYADFLRERALVLEHLGRFDDALTELTLATRMFERGRHNVDDVMDLAQLYCDLGHPTEALRTMAGVSAALSPFGAMRMQLLRLDAAAQLGDPRQVKRSLEYLRKHRLDDAGVYLAALLVVNEPERAAGELVEQLRDPSQRADALTIAQNYLSTPGTPRELERYARWRALLARPDVQAEIKRVGRVESYALEFPFR
jgi:beta-barrel assembly-enhancing protease